MTACHHCFNASNVPQYAYCALCGTYKSMLPATPQDYWKDAESLYKQAWNVDMHTEGGGISKNAFVLSKLACDRESALEIGCAPGRMLYWLRWAAGFEDIIGVDALASSQALDDIRTIGAFPFTRPLFSGIFPNCGFWWKDARFNLIMALDVFEHSDQPERFLAECYRLMKPGGQLLLMLPLSDALPSDSRFFAPAEHVMIHSKRNLTAILEDAGFSGIEWSQWCRGHDLFSARKG